MFNQEYWDPNQSILSEFNILIIPNLNPEGDFFGSGAMDGSECYMDEWPVRHKDKLAFNNKIQKDIYKYLHLILKKNKGKNI